MNSSNFSSPSALGSHSNSQVTHLNNLLGDRFIIQSSLPHSGIGQMYQAVDAYRPSHPQCLIKHFFLRGRLSSKEQQHYQHLRQEALALDQVGTHQHSPQLIAFIEHQNHIYLIREWIEGTSLQTMLEQQSAWTVAAVLNLTIQLLEAFTFLHHHGVIHGSLNAKSVIQHHRSKVWKVTDFKQSTLFSFPQNDRSVNGNPMIQSDLRAMGQLIKTLTAQVSDSTVDHSNLSVLEDAANGLLQYQSPYHCAQSALNQVRSQCSDSPGEAQPLSPSSPSGALPFSAPTMQPLTEVESFEDDNPNRHRAVTTGMATGLIAATALSAGIFYLTPTEEFNGKRATPGMTEPSFITVSPEAMDNHASREPAETTLPTLPVGQPTSNQVLPPVPPPPALRASVPPTGMLPPPPAPSPEASQTSEVQPPTEATPVTDSPESSSPESNSTAINSAAINSTEKNRPTIARDRRHTPLYETAISVLSQQFGDRPEQLLTRMRDLASRYAQDKNYDAELFISQKIETLERQIFPSHHPHHLETNQRQQFLANTLTTPPPSSYATRHHASPNATRHHATQSILDSQYITDRTNADRTVDYDALDATHDPNNSAPALAPEDASLPHSGNVASILETVDTDKIENTEQFSNHESSADSAEVTTLSEPPSPVNSEIAMAEMEDDETVSAELTDDSANDSTDDAAMMESSEPTEPMPDVSQNAPIAENAVDRESVVLYTKMADDGQFLAWIYADNSIVITKVGESHASYRLPYFTGSIQQFTVHESDGMVQIMDQSQAESWWDVHTGIRIPLTTANSTSDMNAPS